MLLGEKLYSYRFAKTGRGLEWSEYLEVIG